MILFFPRGHFKDTCTASVATSSPVLLLNFALIRRLVTSGSRLGKVVVLKLFEDDPLAILDTGGGGGGRRRRPAIEDC